MTGILLDVVFVVSIVMQLRNAGRKIRHIRNRGRWFHLLLKKKFEGRSKYWILEIHKGVQQR